MNQSFMKEKPVLNLILSMSMPMVLSMLVNALYNIADTYFIAKISEDAVTALSLIFPVQNLVNAIAIGFGVGINVNVALFLGGGERALADKAASQGIFLSALHSIFLTLLCIFTMHSFLGAFTKNQSVIDFGIRYSNIVFLFSPALIFNLAFEKIFQAVGKMKVTMISLMCGCITNIILDPLMIFGIGIFPRMGIEGAALATGLGQLVTLLIYLAIYVKRPIPVRIGKKYLRPDKKMIIRLYSVGIPASMNLALPSLLISALNSVLKAFSDVYILSLGIYYKLQTFIYLPAGGIIQGIRPLISYNYGAGEYKRVRKIAVTSLLLNSVIMASGLLLCLTIPDKIMGVFTESEAAVRIGGEALGIISIGFIASAVSVTASGVLEGLGKGFESLIISLCRYIIIIIPAAYILSRLAGAGGVWHAFWITELLTAAVSLILYKYIEKKLLSRG